MSASPPFSPAQAAATAAGDRMDVRLAGTWQITAPRPSWEGVRGGQNPARVRPTTDGVGKWDSSLLLFLFETQQWCRVTGAYFDGEALPEKIRTLLAQLAASHATSVPFDRSESFLTAVGLATQDTVVKGQAIAQFVGECVLGAIGLARSPRKFRWHDCIDEMQQCGAMALPIVSLVSLLVGVTLAYTGAIVLRQYGGDIYIADLIGLSMVREMGGGSGGTVGAASAVGSVLSDMVSRTLVCGTGPQRPLRLRCMMRSAAKVASAWVASRPCSARARIAAASRSMVANSFWAAGSR
jgi:phospholipid/cholesterol/gamma-HCH transport system permease protein